MQRAIKHLRWLWLAAKRANVNKDIRLLLVKQARQTWWDGETHKLRWERMRYYDRQPCLRILLRKSIPYCVERFDANIMPDWFQADEPRLYPVHSKWLNTKPAFVRWIWMGSV